MGVLGAPGTASPDAPHMTASSHGKKGRQREESNHRRSLLPHHNDRTDLQGPFPGEVGPAVLLGHVDTRTGPAVLARLRELRPQDLITTTHSDGTHEKFLVQRVEKVAKTSFPTAEVYGATGHAELRIITCGGAFDHQARSYADNVIVYASLQQTGT
ncbi:sortase [Nonomuraea sp. NPDC049758]|uniref:sortase domain-containing protein n=1 Tax=Nonomuraea sp. NPDC049758 TaxID=3154360 RepID=UPI0034139A10